MTELKFTPGPWRTGKHQTTVISENPVKVTSYSHLMNSDGGVNDKKYYGGHLIAESVLRKENAQLIAAAPEMYRLLVDLVNSEDKEDMDCIKKGAEYFLKGMNLGMEV